VKVSASRLTGAGGLNMGIGVHAVGHLTEVGDILCYYWGQLLCTDHLTDAQIRQGCVMEFHARLLQVSTLPYQCMYDSSTVMIDMNITGLRNRG
jgi:hypothetical protein